MVYVYGKYGHFRFWKFAHLNNSDTQTVQLTVC